VAWGRCISPTCGIRPATSCAPFTEWAEQKFSLRKNEVACVRRCLAVGLFKPFDQAAQIAAWIALYRLGAAWARFSQDHPVVLAPVCCERPWLVDEDTSRIQEIATAMRMVVE
jgi:hypothetical protein